MFSESFRESARLGIRPSPSRPRQNRHFPRGRPRGRGDRVADRVAQLRSRTRRIMTARLRLSRVDVPANRRRSSWRNAVMCRRPLPQPANGPISSKANPGVPTLNDGASRDLLTRRGVRENRFKPPRSASAITASSAHQTAVDGFKSTVECGCEVAGAGPIPWCRASLRAPAERMDANRQAPAPSMNDGRARTASVPLTVASSATDSAATGARPSGGTADEAGAVSAC